MAGDLLTLSDDEAAGEALLQPVMRGGRRVGPLPTLEQLRAHAAAGRARLPALLRSLDPAEPYPVEVSQALRRLTEEVDRAQRAKVPS